MKAITCTLYNTKNLNNYSKMNYKKTTQHKQLITKRNKLIVEINKKEKIKNVYLDQLDEMYTSLHDIDTEIEDLKDSRECWDEIECLIYDV